MRKRIVLTGGGSAGHVTPNLALVPGLEAAGVDVHYIGTAEGIEKNLVTDVPFHTIEAGKLRRYLSRENISDVFRTLRGYRQSKQLLKEIEPDLVFAKGGYVSVPVVYAAAKLHIPVILHESDFTPGLANRLCVRKAKEICLTFDSAEAHGGKGVITGTPVRASLLNGSRAKGLRATGFDGTKPVLLIMGGSLGAQAINEAVDEAIDDLLETYDVVHLRGRGNFNESLAEKKGYKQYEYVLGGLSDIYQATDIALSRAGANALSEFAALRIPPLLIPLPLSASRGDQILNANYYRKNGMARVLEQEKLTKDSLVSSLRSLYEDREEIRANMAASKNVDGTGNVLSVLLEELK